MAEYDFDIGLQEEEFVRVNNASFTRTRVNGKLVESEGPKFSFEAMVVSRKKFINIKLPNDVFLITIELEMLDKEQIPEIVSHIKTSIPTVYEDYQPPTEDDQ
ncbi:hypothetical protein H6F43_03260 [Leptolyngbya sp. FACHB-36]|uniref:hypothetical protein n=1 Tax=Leptolyngbya sp. FACHB-36 TaxID=2692808 RepID=UPI0016809F86|nr:hypothetical protein [Leptolyngbya sp. FACHB-36]MBD2019202.1 hypothetical protein [Leptolyngbya sp. FACHB-36]